MSSLAYLLARRAGAPVGSGVGSGATLLRGDTLSARNVPERRSQVHGLPGLAQSQQVLLAGGLAEPRRVGVHLGRSAVVPRGERVARPKSRRLTREVEQERTVVSIRERPPSSAAERVREIDGDADGGTIRD